MTDRPIDMRLPQVRALLDERKTQDRRVLKHKSIELGIAPRVEVDHPAWIQFLHPQGGPLTCVKWPYAPGDRLWVREAWQSGGLNWGKKPRDMHSGLGPVHYAATDTGDWKLYWGKWKPSIHMPRWASRLTLTVTDVRVQRLQDISEEDAKAEGVKEGDWPDRPDCSCNDDDCLACSHYPALYKPSFRHLWNSLHGPDAWDANPWVVALTFTVQRGNIDEVTK